MRSAMPSSSATAGIKRRCWHRPAIRRSSLPSLKRNKSLPKRRWRCWSTSGRFRARHRCRHFSRCNSRFSVDSLMASTVANGQLSRRQWSRFAAAVLLTCSLCSCAVAQRQESDASRLRETAAVVEEVKAFEKSLGIEPTAALSQTTQNAPALSMLWFRMQRSGTLALRKPVDIRMAVGFSTFKEQLKLEQVYRVDGYSVYYRQGNEFADPRSIATVGFAEEGMVRRVKVILHEDLHGDKNFDLP